MAAVSSVSGPLDAADLGFTLMHEHIVVLSPGVAANFPVWDRERELESAVTKVKEVMARGVKTLVDLTVGDWRDIPFVQEVVQQSGIQLIVATGVYWEVPHYFRAESGRSVDHIAELFVRDIQDGIMDTGVRPASSSAPPTSPASRRTWGESSEPARGRIERPVCPSQPTPTPPARWGSSSRTSSRKRG